MQESVFVDSLLFVHSSSICEGASVKIFNICLSPPQLTAFICYGKQKQPTICLLFSLFLHIFFFSLTFTSHTSSVSLFINCSLGHSCLFYLSSSFLYGTPKHFQTQILKIAFRQLCAVGDLLFGKEEKLKHTFLVTSACFGNIYFRARVTAFTKAAVIVFIQPKYYTKIIKHCFEILAIFYSVIFFPINKLKKQLTVPFNAKLCKMLFQEQC